MPPNTIRVLMEYVLVKSVDPKFCGLSHERRDWRIFPSLQFNAVIVEVEIDGVAIYRPFEEFRRAIIRIVTFMVLNTNDRRTSSPLSR
ncbi:hypothetical protein TNCV_4713201 [Trichonephila clavipes]|nr:hypothetical protein TNCV_4713201 [Trichonephila clavipes]